MPNSTKIEERGGVLIIFFVALLAIMKVLNTTLEEKIVTANNEQVKQSDWYNAKSIKQVMKENERNYLTALLQAGIVDEDESTSLTNAINTTNLLIEKYEAEKIEILVGSANVSERDWAQDVDGEMGKIIGLREWEEVSGVNSKAVTRINLGLLFLQISIVFGLVLLIVDENAKLQNAFTILMIVTGLIGIAISFYGYAYSL